MLNDNNFFLFLSTAKFNWIKFVACVVKIVFFFFGTRRWEMEAERRRAESIRLIGSFSSL